MPSQTRTRRFVGLTAFFAFQLVLAAGAMAQDAEAAGDAAAVHDKTLLQTIMTSGSGREG